jgi:hypothetical protein
VFAAAVLTLSLVLSPTIAIDTADLTPAGDSAGSWDAVFTHSELATARVAGGLTPELRGLIDQRLTAPPAVAARGSRGGWVGSVGVEQWRPLVAAYGGWNVDIMLCLMGYESGGNPDAKNPTSSATGLFQIMASIWAAKWPGNLYDPGHNVFVARQVWGIQGYGAWAPWNRGLCH